MAGDKINPAEYLLTLVAVKSKPRYRHSGENSPVQVFLENLAVAIDRGSRPLSISIYRPLFICPV